MKYVSVRCFDGFSCIADRCPDTCCAGWEVDLDEAILQKYAAIPGPLGEEIRKKIVTEEGYTFFRMEKRRCPFLNDRNLCRLILESGEDCLSVTCREHPRFWEEYGDLQETCLAISCPEAARLLFSAPFRLSVSETDEPGVEDEFLDEELLTALLDIREELFSLAVEELPMERRLDGLTALAMEVQGMDPTPRVRDIPGFLRFLTTLEFTDDRLKALLTETSLPPSAGEVYGALPMEAENLLLYFLYRYVLRAVWDGLVLEKVLLAVYALEGIFLLASGRPGDLRENMVWCAILFSREIEHSPENLEKVYEFLSDAGSPSSAHS